VWKHGFPMNRTRISFGIVSAPAGIKQPANSALGLGNDPGSIWLGGMAI